MIERYDLIVKLTEEALMDLIARARGSCVTFKAKTLAKRAGLSTKPITLTLITHYLSELEAKGLVSVWKRGSHGTKYIVTRESPLWQEAKRLAEEITLKVRG